MRYVVPGFVVCFLVVFVFSLTLGCGGKKASDGPPAFVYAMSGMYRPFNYMEGGELRGFDVDIGYELSRRMGREAKPVTHPWETIIQGLRTGNYDAIIGSMAITEERAKQVDFSRPYYRSGAQIFVSEDHSDINGPDDLATRRVGVVRSSTFRDIALKLTEDDRQVIGYDSDIMALRDLTTGRIDAVITDQVVGLAAIHDQSLALTPLGSLLFTDEMAIAVPLGNPQTVAAINQALEAMIADGTYEKISDKWFGHNILGE